MHIHVFCVELMHIEYIYPLTHVQICTHVPKLYDTLAGRRTPTTSKNSPSVISHMPCSSIIPLVGWFYHDFQQFFQWYSRWKKGYIPYIFLEWLSRAIPMTHSRTKEAVKLTFHCLHVLFFHDFRLTASHVTVLQLAAQALTLGWLAAIPDGQAGHGMTHLTHDQAAKKHLGCSSLKSAKQSTTNWRYSMFKRTPER